MNPNPKPVDPKFITGERNGKAKLTNQQVIEIRERYQEGDITQQQLADEYGVARSTIANIVRSKGRHWRWIK